MSCLQLGHSGLPSLSVGSQQQTPASFQLPLVISPVWHFMKPLWWHEAALIKSLIRMILLKLCCFWFLSVMLPVQHVGLYVLFLLFCIALEFALELSLMLQLIRFCSIQSGLQIMLHIKYRCKAPVARHIPMDVKLVLCVWLMKWWAWVLLGHLPPPSQGNSQY